MSSEEKVVRELGKSKDLHSQPMNRSSSESSPPFGLSQAKCQPPYLQDYQR
jgi:hypothetical protein